MNKKPKFLRFLFYTGLYAIRYFTVGSWVRLKWHYLCRRGKKYYL